jgi:hypothetical protein
MITTNPLRLPVQDMTGTTRRAAALLFARNLRDAAAGGRVVRLDPAAAVLAAALIMELFSGAEGER